MKTEELLKFKKDKKSSNPKFIRQDIHKKKRLDKIWRKPRGCDSKKRLMKNNRVVVKPGYGTPKELRDLDKLGKKIVNIKLLNSIKELEASKHSVIVSGKIGMKNRLLIIDELLKNNIDILNIVNPKKYIEDIRKNIDKKKKKKAEKIKKEKIVKEKKEKDSIEDKLTDDEKKKLEKQEIDRLLTKKF